MTTTLVMIHGGQHTGYCWTPTINALHQLTRDTGAAVTTLAVNLPGHGGEAGNLETLTIEQSVDSVCRQVLATSPEQVILVGHSMAGITLPGVAVKLGKALVRRVIFLACCVPPEGQSVRDTLRPPTSWITQWLMRNKKITKPMPAMIAKWLFTNGATPEQHQVMLDSLCDESTEITRQPTHRQAFLGFKTTWILTLGDRALSPSLQRQFIKNLGGVDALIEIDACHNAMITQPETLAKLLIER